MTVLPESRLDCYQAVFFAGTTSYLWNQTPELKALFLSACSLEEGMDVVLIGKFLEDTGLVSAMESILRSWGNLRVVELAPQAVAAWQASGTAAGSSSMRWDFSYLDEIADGSLDRVVLFNAACHVSNWEYLAAQIGRTLCRGGRAVIAEAPMGGAAFQRALALHPGLQDMIGQLLRVLSVDESCLAQPDPDDLTTLLASHLTWTRVHEWQGLYVCYGQKGLTEREELEASMAAEMASQGGDSELAYVPGPDPFTAFPPANIWVRSFLKARPVRTTWSLMSKLEKEIWSDAAVELVLSERGQRVKPVQAFAFPISSGLAGFETPSPGPAPQALVVCPAVGRSEALAQRAAKVLEGFLGYLPVRESSDLLKRGKMDNPCDLAELLAKYPRDYFDVLLIEAGLTNCETWEETVPLLLSVLKSGGKLVFFAQDREAFRWALSQSAFARLLAARLLAPADPAAAESGAVLDEIVSTRAAQDVQSMERALVDVLDDCSVVKRGGFVLVCGRKPRSL